MVASNLTKCFRCGHLNQPSARYCVRCGTALNPSLRLPSVGERLNNGRYEIERPLKKGGMGATFLARDLGAFGRRCVIKVMLPYYDPADPDEHKAALQRFEREAKALAELGAHPNIPNLLDWFEDGGQFYLVMEFIEGDDLESKLEREGAQPVDVVVHWGISLCKTLEFMDQKGYIHHDIKPANIILQASSGEPILVDFGTVKAAHKAVQASFGTIGYAPPEQLPTQLRQQLGIQYTGADATEHRSDVYALAASLYQLITGDDPRDNPYRFPKLSTVPEPLRGALKTALALNPQDRPRASELRNMLEELKLRFSGVVVPVFISRSGCRVASPDELADYAKRHWDEAVFHFSRGDIEAWLRGMGRFDLVTKAEDARKNFEGNFGSDAALQAFIESFNPAVAPRPKMQVSTNAIDLGEVMVDSDRAAQVAVSNVGDGFLFGSALARGIGIEVQPRVIKCKPGETQLLQIKVCGSKLPMHRHQRLQVHIDTNGGSEDVSVELKLSLLTKLLRLYGEGFGRVSGAVGGAILGAGIGFAIGWLIFVAGGIVGALIGTVLGAAGGGSASNDAGGLIGGMIGGAIIGYILGAVIGAIVGIGVGVVSLGFCSVHGVRVGAHVGRTLSQRYGVVPMAMTISAILSFLLGCLWMVLNMLSGAGDKDTHIMLALVTVTGMLIGSLVGAAIFAVITRMHGEGMQKSDTILAASFAPIGLAMALVFYNMLSQFGFPSITNIAEKFKVAASKEPSLQPKQYTKTPLVTNVRMFKLMRMCVKDQGRRIEPLLF
ncbi:MAG: serine/threonine-protein kinase [Armatimonadota bacterium]|nr:serine/threonine-protein kinase [Armatimonadota bacterium]